MSGLFDDVIEIDCIFCLSARTALVRVDKKGRPCVTCHACGTRSVISSVRGLRGLSLLRTGQAQKRLDDSDIEETQIATAARQLQLRLGAFT